MREANQKGCSFGQLLFLFVLLQVCSSAPDVYYKKTQGDYVAGLFRSVADGLRDVRKLSSDVFQSPKLSNPVPGTLDQQEEVMNNGGELFSSDDLFSGLSAVWSNKNTLDAAKTSNEYKDISNTNLEASGIYSDDEVSFNQLDNQNNGNEVNIANESELITPNDVKENSEHNWSRLKVILGNMKSVLKDINGEQTSGLDTVFESIDRIVEFGDKVNIIESIKESFDPELLEFLGLKWNNTKNEVLQGHPILKSLLSTTQYTIPKTIIYGLLKTFGHYLHNQAFLHLNELDFVTNVMRSSGFKPEEIREVFNLLEIPADTLGDDYDYFPLDGRSYANNARYDYDLSRTGGYGHSSSGYSSGGHGGGGYMMSTFDPFVLLAGLAFATFAAYIIYRLLSSTTGGKRSAPNINVLALDLSDVPTILDNIYTWIGKAEEKYGNNQIDSNEVSVDSFSDQAFQMWQNFKADRLSKSCVRRYLCDNVQNTIYTMDSSSTLNTLSLVSLAAIFGDEGAGKMVDNLQSEILDGKESQCSQPNCDDITYQEIKAHKKHKSKI